MNNSEIKNSGPIKIVSLCNRLRWQKEEDGKMNECHKCDGAITCAFC